VQSRVIEGNALRVTDVDAGALQIILDLSLSNEKLEVDSVPSWQPAVHHNLQQL
jgi:hypothetical protein